MKRWLPPAQLWSSSSSSSSSSPQVRALEKLSDVMQGHCVKDAQFKVIGIDSAQETVDAPDNAGHYCCQQADDDFFAIWCQSCQALLTKALIMKGSATAALGLFLVSSQSALADESIEAGVQEAPDLVANNTLSFLFIASFLGLSVLTIGVVYLSVQDFLEKRQLESESKAVAQGKKSKATPEVVEAGQSGPRGFGGKRAKEKGKD